LTKIFFPFFFPKKSFLEKKGNFSLKPKMESGSLFMNPLGQKPNQAVSGSTSGLRAGSAPSTKVARRGLIQGQEQN
jgi:hypothetical protein